MSPKHLVFAVVLASLWVANVSAQVTSPTASPSTSTASDKAGASSTGANSPNGTTDPNAVAPTMDVSGAFPLQGTPSTGSDATSPPPVPGSPPTAPR
jgi:hypothetical protein